MPLFDQKGFLKMRFCPCCAPISANLNAASWWTLFFDVLYNTGALVSSNLPRGYFIGGIVWHSAILLTMASFAYRTLPNGEILGCCEDEENPNLSLRGLYNKCCVFPSFQNQMKWYSIIGMSIANIAAFATLTCFYNNYNSIDYSSNDSASSSITELAQKVLGILMIAKLVTTSFICCYQEPLPQPGF